ncbi:MAG: gliding motility-associated C-terminal domain-containing protein [Marinifilaceae bacterium]|jgi:gliding motility-associated-like protein|nr:gliding motility-associated C-terminal domain-containing protein [Marinifilaceae bacterium]
MFNFKFTSFFFLGMFLISIQSFGQISSSAANTVISTDYNTGRVNDNIFIFKSSTTNTVGELKYEFEILGKNIDWYKWNEATSFYDNIATNVENVSNLSTGFYKLSVDDGIDVENYYAWVIVNNRKEIKIKLELQNCAGNKISVDYESDAMFYYQVDKLDNVLAERVLLKREDKYILERDAKPIIDFIYDETNYLNLTGSLFFTDTNAFEGVSDYKVKVEDKYNCEFESNEISSETFAVEAKFNVEPKKGEAPLDVKITNQSINTDSYQWFLYRDTDRIKEDRDILNVEDSLVNNQILTDRDIESYTYLYSGNYIVKLIASNLADGLECKSTYLLSEDLAIIVDTSLVDIPNFFTPNGDGKNDLFKVRAESLLDFKGVVFNRWGQELYVWTDPTEGWNGKHNGRKCSPGTYFYMIKARGREVPNKTYVEKGSFMLIREK